MAAVGVFAIALTSWLAWQKQAVATQKRTLLAIQTLGALEARVPAVEARATARGEALERGKHEFLVYGEHVQPLLGSSDQNPKTPWGSTWYYCIWRNDAGLHGALWEMQIGGDQLDITSLMAAGLDPRGGNNYAGLKSVLAKAAEANPKLRVGIIEPRATNVLFRNGAREPIPCLADLNDAEGAAETRLGLVLLPQDLARPAGERQGIDPINFARRELAVTLKDTVTAGGGYTPSLEALLDDAGATDANAAFGTLSGGLGSYSGLTVTAAFYARLVGRADRPDGANGITVVMIGGGGAAGPGHRLVEGETYTVTPGGGGGSGYVETFAIPKEMLNPEKGTAQLVIEPGRGGVPGTSADGAPSCVSVYQATALVRRVCAPGGRSGFGGRAYDDQAGNRQRALASGGAGGSGGGVGQRLGGVCASKYQANWSDCALDARPGSGGALGSDGEPAIGASDKPLGIPGTGQGAGFLPTVDGIRFQGPTHSAYNDVAVRNPSGYSTNALASGFQIGGGYRDYNVFWWDTGGYGICFTQTPTAGLRPDGKTIAPIDPPCYTYINNIQDLYISPNRRATGRGYGAGGMSCASTTAGYIDHCAAMPNVFAVSDGTVDPRAGSYGAHGAVYLYWLEKP
jgi:hypothetical protein